MTWEMSALCAGDTPGAQALELEKRRDLRGGNQERLCTAPRRWINRPMGAISSVFLNSCSKCTFTFESCGGHMVTDTAFLASVTM